MGMFFEKVNRKSAMPVVVLRITIALGMVILFIMGITNDFDFFYIGLMFMLGAVGSVIDGVERLYRNEKRKLSLLDFGLAAVYVIVGLTLYL
ncbi:hypothetical protein RYX56_00650 [Alkalihalophilus lindianensis]|uniref:CDP-alcohol phosphatidyltransferase n=1 Tax=Alkalihalophilus lindianensis TaxID=1630542 RepID=A0ABU3X511_9BACI|nr:hypothetical protein [Alkalihalophilus lindianensis]MDV2682873.1 hypothetical protein [Alkalihalophilus lindianensis]